MREQTTVGHAWSLYKMGGLTPALAAMFGSNNASQVAYIRSLAKNSRAHSAMELELEQMDIVVFDLETTGFYANGGDEILSFGAVRMQGGTVAEDDASFYSLVNPGRDVPASITALTGISEAMAKDAPPLVDVLHAFMQFVGKSTLVAHSSSHDKAFLTAALWRTSRIHLSHRIVDTMMISKWLNPALRSHSLDECLADAGISLDGYQRHHALDDSWLTARLWQHYLTRIRAKQVRTLGDMYAYLSRH